MPKHEPGWDDGKYQLCRCELCWEAFESPVALLLHEAQEDDRLYDIDGLTDDQAPSKYGLTR